MALALLDVYRHHNSTAGIEIALQGPPELFQRIQQTMLHHGVSDVDNLQPDYRFFARVEEHTLLNWIQANGWKINHFGTSTDDYYTLHPYVFEAAQDC